MKQQILIEESEHINPSIAFIDTEIDPKSQKILDIGSVKDNDAYFHKTSELQMERLFLNYRLLYPKPPFAQKPKKY